MKKQTRTTTKSGASKSAAANKASVYEIVTGRIIEQLERALAGEGGCIPWRKPWNAKAEWPRNLISGKPYQGINVFLLSSQRYESPYWLTFKQAADRGATVRKGEKSTPVIFWSFVEKEEEQPDGTLKKGRVGFLRYYSVFNVSQIDGLKDVPAPEAVEIDEDEALKAAAGIVAAMPNRPEIKHGFTQACYVPSCDEVRMPSQASFHQASGYFATLFHELTHSTLHESRVNRKVQPYELEERSKEELCAEIGASFLCAAAGIEGAELEENTTAYIQSWLKALRNDPKMVILAAAQAQKSTDFILGNGAAQEEAEPVAYDAAA